MKLQLIQSIKVKRLPKKNTLQKGYKVGKCPHCGIPYIEEVVLDTQYSSIMLCGGSKHGSYTSYPEHWTRRKNTTLFKTTKEAKDYIKERYKAMLWEK